jgi:hypothetical protein
MALGQGLNPQGGMMGINPEKFEWLVRNVDPAPVWQAINTPQPQMQPQAQGAPYAEMLEGEAWGAGLTPGSPDLRAMQQNVAGQKPVAGGGAMMPPPQQKPQQVAPAPSVAPRAGGMVDFPSAAVPRGSKPVPTLAELLRG